MTGTREISLSDSRKNMEAVEQAEGDARQIIDAAVTVDGVERFPPLSDVTLPQALVDARRERWWLTVFGATEDELREQQRQLAAHYRQLRFKPHRRRERKQIKAAYIRIDAMLTVAHGLTTVWG